MFVIILAEKFYILFKQIVDQCTTEYTVGINCDVNKNSAKFLQNLATSFSVNLKLNFPDCFHLLLLPRKQGYSSTSPYHLKFPSLLFYPAKLEVMAHKHPELCPRKAKVLARLTAYVLAVCRKDAMVGLPSYVVLVWTEALSVERTLFKMY